jgi:hypothetical protein
MSLLSDDVVVTLPPGFDATVPLADLLVSAGLATGAWHFEGTLLEVALGRTFDREVPPQTRKHVGVLASRAGITLARPRAGRSS